MLLQYEINRFRDDLTKDFNEKEISSLLHRAVIDLKNRNIAGVIIVPFSYLLGCFATEYASEQIFLFSFFGFILLAALISRIMAIIAIKKREPYIHQGWLSMFFWSNLFVGLTWGGFAGTAVLLYHDSPSITLIIILLAGISGGSMASYSIWKILSYAYLLIILLPAICANFYIGNQ